MFFENLKNTKKRPRMAHSKKLSTPKSLLERLLQSFTVVLLYPPPPSRVPGKS